ncbi:MULTISPECIES: mitochondrial fission ELM1 family protein [unclassified Thioalkalivibrio]|uniref:mitochondrial fission ELM1 family protein n=1 Tax=unclassified Thioalkalivibrio TaxID=2621013 RepID=UPI0003625A9A|nr:MULTISPECIES: mitochondrial fission ELM1 family protein [unclassified Thioalkalivibrio]
MNEISCWTLTTGEAGMTSQVRGLAEAVGLPYEHKTVGLRRPWRWMPGSFVPGVLRGLTAGSDALEPPWPRLLISCGRRSAAVAVALKRASGGAIMTVHVQDPQISPRHFDWVVPPRHDGLAGPNVIATRGALHRVTAERLEAARRGLGDAWAAFPRPWVAVLIGGATQRGDLGQERLDALIRDLRSASEASGGSVLVTPSRRTGAASTRRLVEGLADVPGFVWDGQGENPFMAMLATADHIVVSADSVSMVSEAAATGVPVYTVALGPLGRRLQAFHSALEAEGVTRPFTGALDQWSYAPVNDTPKVAAHIRRELGLDGEFSP